MADLQLPEHRIRINSASGWREAVTDSLSLLHADGLITEEYIATVLQSISSGDGLYMDLGFGVCLAHTRPEHGALGVGIALNRLTKTVNLNDDPAHPVQQIWSLCALDSHSHQQLMAAFASVLMNADIREGINQARTVKEIQDLIQRA